MKLVKQILASEKTTGKILKLAGEICSKAYRSHVSSMFAETPKIALDHSKIAQFRKMISENGFAHDDMDNMSDEKLYTELIQPLHLKHIKRARKH